ncbi:hypothetical protein BpHYR1_048646 [Brachionus plicatilis]|uniref:Uncharacterized protein n=1 Tax=Brachionus plicatilis TaxID=10195 RepID=A0A3M7QIC9_BRAPC|nr:hypothetical protein BpHYR1_048646 [Brachionus plicatilis]
MEDENDEKKFFNKLVDLGLIFAVKKCTKENCRKKAQNMNLTTPKRSNDSKNCLLTYKNYSWRCNSCTTEKFKKIELDHDFVLRTQGTVSCKLDVIFVDTFTFEIVGFPIIHLGNKQKKYSILEFRKLFQQGLIPDFRKGNKLFWAYFDSGTISLFFKRFVNQVNDLINPYLIPIK